MLLRVISKLILILSIFAILLVNTTEAAAGKKKKKPKPKKPNYKIEDIVKVEVEIKKGKSTKTYEITCNKKTPGILQKKRFIPYASAMNGLKGSAKSNKKAKAKYDLYKKLKSAGKTACLEPEYLSLQPYKGKFEASHAHTIYNRFGFGASPEKIAWAVSAGIDRTIQDLVTYKPEPQFDLDELELRCDGYLLGDSRNVSGNVDECPPGNRNAVRDTGVRFDLYNRFWLSENTFHNRLWLFLHDERMAGVSGGLSGCDRYALVDHVHMLRKASISGDYIQFMRDWNNDYLGHLISLDGASNSPDAPNENYAREFWELGTVGPTSTDGSPVYTDLDIAQSALAFTGWIKEYDEFKDDLGNDYGVCYGAKADLRHAPGTKTIFIGTKFEAVVDTDEDVLKATFAHDRTAEHLAEDIWKEFINPFATEKSIKQLAQIIRDKNYNLIEVLKIVAGSRAVHAEKSQKSLIKHPLQLVFGFLRQTNIHLLDSISVDEDTGRVITNANKFEKLEWEVIDDLGQIPTRPITVFGWNEKRLAGELYVLPWRNAAMWLVNQDPDALEQWTGFSFRDHFFTGLPPAGLAAPALVDKVASMLNISINENQKASLVQFLDYRYVNCTNEEKNNPSLGCDANGKRLKKQVFDPDPAADESNVTVLRGLLGILAQLPEYRMN